MDAGIIGAILGSAIGILGGVIGTYFSIKNTKGPRERAFIIKASVICWIFILAFLVCMYLLPGIYKASLMLVYIMVLPAGILLWNKKQKQIYLEESKHNT